MQRVPAVRVLEARVRRLGESAYVIVGHVIWTDGQDDDSPVVQMNPSLACDAESSALLCQLWYFVNATAPRSFERLPRMQNPILVVRGRLRVGLCLGTAMPLITRLRQATVCFALTTVATVVIAIGGLASARTVTTRDQEALASLAGDVARIAQAEIAAERMVAVGRTYLLTNEPDLLARAQAAEATLDRTLRDLQQHLMSRGYDDRMIQTMDSATRYRARFEQVMSRPLAAERPAELAATLRHDLVPARDRVQADLQALVEARQLRQTEMRLAAEDRTSRVLRRLELLALLGALGTTLLAWFIIERLGRVNAVLAAVGMDRKDPPRPTRPPPSSEPTPPAATRRTSEDFEPTAPATPAPGIGEGTTPPPRWWPRP